MVARVQSCLTCEVGGVEKAQVVLALLLPVPYLHTFVKVLEFLGFFWVGRQ